MRLGKDVLEADLYGVLGILPDATDSEIRVAYRRQVRTSHPDLNQGDPEAVPRMKRLNVAARVLLDPALRRAYDHAPRPAKRSRSSAGSACSDTKPSRQRAWFERSELSFDDDWAPPAPPETPQPRAGFVAFFRELRGRDGHFSLQVQDAINSLSPIQQLTFAATLCALAIALIIMARPAGLIGDSVQPTSIDSRSVYP
jgi:curved DNA-binding protein CbpA